MKRLLLVLLLFPSLLAAQTKVSGTVPLTVTASDITATVGDTECGVQRVQFFLDGAALGPALTTAPYIYNWDSTKTSEGNHEIRAIAYDKSGGPNPAPGQECSGTAPNASVAATRTVEVDNIQPDITPPTVTITAPASASIVSGHVNFTAMAADPSGVGRMDLYVGGRLEASATNTGKASYNWNTNPYKGQMVVLKAQAWDLLGNGPGTKEIRVTVRK